MQKSRIFSKKYFETLLQCMVLVYRITSNVIQAGGFLKAFSDSAEQGTDMIVASTNNMFFQRFSGVCK